MERNGDDAPLCVASHESSSRLGISSEKLEYDRKEPPGSAKKKIFTNEYSNEYYQRPT